MSGNSNVNGKAMRNRIQAMIWVTVVMLGAAGCGGASRPSSTGQKPNIVIIVADDLGYGDVSVYGAQEHQTPEIDRLASEGVKCTDFYVPVPYCAPSRATLLTGRFPLRHGLTKNPAPDASAAIDTIGIHADEVMLGEVLQTEGYHTKLIGKWHLGHQEKYFPVKHGFDEYFGILYSNDMRPVQLIEDMDTVAYPLDQTHLTETYTDKALEFIARHKDQPFFLQLCHAMPHKPLAASDAFYTPDTPDDLYDDVMRELDFSTGRIVEALRTHNILDNTIVIFMSDNGPWYGGNTGGLKGMKATPWEGGTRVPFIIRFPEALPKGTTVSTPCWSPDLFPTILHLAGIDLPPAVALDGSDITDILAGRQTSHDPIFSMQGNKVVSIRDGQWKLYVRAPAAYVEKDLREWKDPRAPDGKTLIAPYAQYSPEEYPGVKPERVHGEAPLLFNLREDMAERENVSAKYPAITKRLMAKYQAFVDSFNSHPDH